MSEGASAAFNVSTATLAAGFAFEAYNEPSQNDARWERGADGIDVAFLSEDFAREVYDGILEVRLREAVELAEQKELAQALMSGSERDPYVIFAMNEEREEGPKEGAVGLGRAVDQVRPRAAHAVGAAPPQRAPPTGRVPIRVVDGPRWPSRRAGALFDGVEQVRRRAMEGE